MEQYIQLFEELIEAQKKRLLHVAREIVPHITDDDLLQPNDFPLLEEHSYFRFEEGYLLGLMGAKSAFLALMKDLEKTT